MLTPLDAWISGSRGWPSGWHRGASTDSGAFSTDFHNIRLGEFERLLGGVHIPRVTYRILPLPPWDAELVRRNQVLTALDNWISGLRR